MFTVSRQPLILHSGVLHGILPNLFYYWEGERSLWGRAGTELFFSGFKQDTVLPSQLWPLDCVFSDEVLSGMRTSLRFPFLAHRFSRRSPVVHECSLPTKLFPSLVLPPPAVNVWNLSTESSSSSGWRTFRCVLQGHLRIKVQTLHENRRTSDPSFIVA